MSLVALITYDHLRKVTFEKGSTVALSARTKDADGFAAIVMLQNNAEL